MKINKIPVILISAPKRSSGKTTITTGICQAYTQKGFQIHPFKKGPDFIDPMWLSAASNRNCYNLDHYMMTKDQIIQSYIKRGFQGELAVVEGNQSLFDGIDISGTGSTASIARLLKLPVILVIDTKGVNRGIAPIINGLLQFEPETNIRGVILNQVKGKRHESKLREAIEYFCDIEVIGAVPGDSTISIEERHLGLVPIQEDPAMEPIIRSIGTEILKSVNLNRLLELAKENHVAESYDIPDNKDEITYKNVVRIGIPRDRAFNFYYSDNLEALEKAGAKLVFFNTLTDNKMPDDIQGLYIGGGFPESMMDYLSGNESVRESIRLAVENGMPVYAECGGLMYLCRSIQWKDRVQKMVGAIPCDIEMVNKPVGFGYVLMETENASHWLNPGQEIKGHEFHYSKVLNCSELQYGYRVKRGYGINGAHDGILYKNVFASYTHIHAITVPDWGESFISFVKSVNYRQ